MKGRFGRFGGQYVPETVMNALIELEREFEEAKKDEKFMEEYRYYLKEYSGRPTPLYYAENLTKRLGGAKIYLKREDLNHTGAHKINNVLGQVLLAKRMGKTSALPLLLETALLPCFATFTPAAEAIIATAVEILKVFPPVPTCTTGINDVVSIQLQFYCIVPHGFCKTYYLFHTFPF